ncbi:hypothetical protein GCM10010365_56310 [Streptomyces poonensis]|uniref:Uncharacterized protein n=1 Tax=Streptomyces poonensis TaxID=68255 RepID=A0A918URR4_9ACTN|nr:hypothetical protein GCM10010365_56310 [Streptomyces poonensis]
MDREDGGDAQGVTLAAPYGDALVECGALGGLRFGGAEEVGDLARHVEGDRRFRGRAPGSTAVYPGRRSATAVRMAPRLTSWSRARAAMERPSGTRYVVGPRGWDGGAPPAVQGSQ